MRYPGPPSFVAVGLLLVLILGAWPHLFALSLQPESRDAVLWITRSATSNPTWERWVFLRDHFVAYRPVTALSYTADSVIGGFAVEPYRATDLLIHLACAVALFVLARRLAPKAAAWGGLVATAVFLAHPAAAHVVPHLARRSYSLSTLFAAAGLAVIAGSLGAARLVAAASLLVLSALSNEAGYAAFPAAAALIGMQPDRTKRWRASAIALLAMVGVGLVIVRLLVLGDLGGYAVERGSRAFSIVAALARGVVGLDVLRSSTGPLLHFVPEVLTVLVAGGLTFPMFAGRREVPEEAKASLIGWVWLTALALSLAIQGVFFPRQLYVLAAPFALVLAFAACAVVSLRRLLLRVVLAAALWFAVIGLMRQSPVLLGPDPAQKMTWVRNDELVRDLAKAVAAQEPNAVVIPIVPYYERPEVHALRARADDNIPKASFEALAWVDATTHGGRFHSAVSIVHDARSFEPTATMKVTPEGIEVTVPAGAEIVPQERGVRIDTRADGTRVFRPVRTIRGKGPTIVYFNDGLSGTVVPLGRTADPRYASPPAFPDEAMILSIEDDAHDGTLTGTTFHPDGVGGVNRAANGSSILLEFGAPADLPPSQIYARLDLPVVAEGGDGPLELVIRGRLDAGDLADGEARSTAASVRWTVPVPWSDPNTATTSGDERLPVVCTPLQRKSPDVAPIVTEALAQNVGPLRFSIEAIRGTLLVQDSVRVSDPECPGPVAPQLELYPTLRSTFVAKELVGRPTDHTATLSMMSLVAVEIAVDFGAGSEYDRMTGVTTARAGEPAQIELDGLRPDAVAHYRIRARRPGSNRWDFGPDRTIRTPRPPGSPFTFTVTADSHHLNMVNRRSYASMHLFAATMEHIAAGQPDFHLDLGDTFHTESYASYDAPDDGRRCVAISLCGPTSSGSERHSSLRSATTKESRDGGSLREIQSLDARQRSASCCTPIPFPMTSIRATRMWSLTSEDRRTTILSGGETCSLLSSIHTGTPRVNRTTWTTHPGAVIPGIGRLGSHRPTGSLERSRRATRHSSSCSRISSREERRCMGAAGERRPAAVRRSSPSGAGARTQTASPRIGPDGVNPSTTFWWTQESSRSCMATITNSCSSRCSMA
jgi:hypothetical protein